MARRFLIPLLLLTACTAPKDSADSGDTADSGDSGDPHAIRTGAYVQDRWQLRVGYDEGTGLWPATFETDCGAGGVDDLGVVDGAFSVAFDWRSGGGAYEPPAVPATLAGTVDGDTLHVEFVVDEQAGLLLDLVYGEQIQLYDCP
jgi:hypothetical protein